MFYGGTKGFEDRGGREGARESKKKKEREKESERARHKRRRRMERHEGGLQRGYTSKWPSVSVQARHYRFVVLDVLLLCYSYLFIRAYGEIFVRCLCVWFVSTQARMNK